MIAELLPAEVASAEAYEDPPEVELFAEEEAVIARAVDKRRREFRTVRYCARRALGELGVAPVPLLPGDGGAPQWPAGVVGSMTHCAGYRAAAVAHQAEVHTLGIDAEPHDVLPAGVLGAVTLDEERCRLATLGAGNDSVCWDRLLFCTKEAVYKAWFPLTGRWLGFQDASITIDPVGGTFWARLLVPGPPVAGTELPGFAGRWLVRNGLVLATIAVPAGSNR